jgi:hypothetical protein
LLLCLPLGRCGISALRRGVPAETHECRDGALIAVGSQLLNGRNACYWLNDLRRKRTGRPFIG